MAENVNITESLPGATRRDAIKFIGLGFVALATGLIGRATGGRALSWLGRVLPGLPSRTLGSRTHSGPDGDREYHWGMVIDLGKCIGCDYCVDACQATNDVADDMQWNVRVVDQTETGDIFHLTRNCLMCEEAPCVTVCPVEATFNRDIDGLVVMDYDKCIGCRYCQVACPYDVRRFNWGFRSQRDNSLLDGIWGPPEVERRTRGVVEKCTFCVHRIDQAYERGLTPGVDRSVTPACVNACPVEARFFGNLNDPNSPASRQIEEKPTIRLREELGTETSVYYIPPEFSEG